MRACMRACVCVCVRICMCASVHACGNNRWHKQCFQLPLDAVAMVTLNHPRRHVMLWVVVWHRFQDWRRYRTTVSTIVISPRQTSPQCTLQKAACCDGVSAKPLRFERDSGRDIRFKLSATVFEVMSFDDVNSIT